MMHMLHAFRLFQKQHLSFIETWQDFDVFVQIALQEEKGAPLSPKQLVHANLGASATIQRRLARLKRLGVVIAHESHRYGRKQELRLNPRIWTMCKRYKPVMVRALRRAQVHSDDLALVSVAGDRDRERRSE